MDVEKEHHSYRNTPSAIARFSSVSAWLLAALTWGSALLIFAIARLQSISLELQQARAVNQITSEILKKEFIEGALTPNRIGFEQSRNSTFRPKFKPIQWISEPDSYINDKGLFVTTENSTYVIRSIEDESYENILHSGSNIVVNNTEYEINEFVASPDLKFALLQTNHTQHWRHSSYGLYWILNVETGEVNQIHPQKISLALWSPISDSVAFVLDNNVYIYDLNDFSTSQVTSDGGANIFNGKPDWVYEEEVIEGDSALWWSPNGKFVAFLRTNDSEVPEFPIAYFVQGDSSDVYPDLRNIKYPKPGFPNPVVDIVLYNVETQRLENIDYSDDIFTEVLWVGNNKLLLKTINRSADFLKVVLIDAETFTFEVVRDETTDSWFEITHDTFFVPKSKTVDDDGYIDTISANGYNHLAYFSPPSNSTPKLLTEGEWEVVSAPTAFDYTKNLVYYFATKESSMERHLYSVHLGTGEIRQYTENEGWYSASFSTGARFASLTYHGPSVPSQKLVDFSTGDSKVLESNKELKELLDNFDLPHINYGEVDIGTATVNYVERLPPNFNSSKQYPILFFVYGGPGSQLVTKTFSISFTEVVASQLDAVVVTVDGRGTGFKGREFRAMVRDKLGHYEVIDQIAAAKHWVKKSYIDESRVAIFGWSYGGYMTLKTLEADAGNTFKYGLSVAPVTDWRLYDSVYTERYMHLPEDNLSGYEDSSVHNITALGESQRFLLMHGSGDDNVHTQNTFKILDKFNLEGIENYDLHIFPDSDHAIRYHNADVIVYDKLLWWLKKAFRGDYL